MNISKILTFFRSRERCRIQRTFYSTMPFEDVPWSSLCWLNDRLEWKYGTWSKNVLVAISFFELWIMIICILLDFFFSSCWYYSFFFWLDLLDRVNTDTITKKKRHGWCDHIQFQVKFFFSLSRWNNKTSQNSLISCNVFVVLRA